MTLLLIGIPRTAVGTFVLMLCSVFSAHAQQQGDRWYFGDGVGLDFSGGELVVLHDGATYTDSTQGSPLHSEASSVICDSEGNLLFYTNGEKIWDRDHRVMPNGDGLLGHFSSTQGALIVPLPESDRYFCVFTTDAFLGNGLGNGFRYSVVDMCMSDSLGDVVEGQKNILLLDTVAEKLSAVRHANGRDYWVVTHKFYSDRFYAYHLTPQGIGDVVVSAVGAIHPDPPIVSYPASGAAIGQMKISPDGTRLSIVNGNSNQSIADLCDFDAMTGLVSNCFSLQVNPNYNYYGVSFSPDNTKLYISCWLNDNGIHQFNLLAGSSDAIRESRVVVSPYNAYGLQLANDGKIYAAYSQVNRYLDVIHEPNNLGLACNFQDSAIWLEGRVASMGLPNFIDSYAYTNGLVSCTEEVVPDTLVIPTAFTPDGDGVNDAFEVENLPAGSELVIYSRWGREVYRSESYAGGWDAANVTGGVYYCILTLPDGGMRKGVVHVLK